MKISGKRARMKGIEFEREVCEMLRGITGVTAKRKIEYQEGSYDIDTNLPFNIQCKIGASPRRPDEVIKWVEYADGETPVAIIKRDRGRPTATLFLDDFLDIVAVWHELKNQECK